MIPQLAFAGGLFRFPQGITLEKALGISLLVHLVVLSIHFSPPDIAERLRERALDVILVNSKSARAPEKAQARAQANLDGGGNTEEDLRAKTPLPPSEVTREGNDLIEKQRRVAELEQLQQQLLLSAKANTSVAADARRNMPTPDSSVVKSGAELASNAMASARLLGQISRQTYDYSQRPRKKFIGARVEEYRFSQYIEDWRQKIIRIGNLNYPESVRGKIFGSLVLSVVIKSTGELEKVEIDRSSGKKILDDAAVRIVLLAGTGGFSPFPENIRQDTDVLVITRTWTFSVNDKLHDD
jgi:protein TonB